MRPAIKLQAERLARQLVAGDRGPGTRMCSHRYQCGHRRSMDGECESIDIPPTPEVIYGPPCPVHGGRMHRIPGLPGVVTGWNCHGYDGEGCTIDVTTKTEVTPLIGTLSLTLLRKYREP